MNKEASCTFLIRHLQFYLEKQFNKTLSELGITISQVGALAVILESSDVQLSLKQLEKEWNFLNR